MEGQPLVHNETVNYTTKRIIVRKAKRVLTKKVTAYSFAARNSARILNFISRPTAKQTELPLRGSVEERRREQIWC